MTGGPGRGDAGAGGDAPASLGRPAGASASTGAGDAAIEVVDLGKIFHPPGGVRELFRGQLTRSPVRALEGVSFRLARGEVVCVMGPNGAGKSTLLRILSGLLMPTTGRARVAGLDVASHGLEFRRRVAFVVGDERSFHWPLSGRQNLEYFGALHGYSPAEARRRAGELLSNMGLDEAADRTFHTYSRGMRQRLALARGLLGAAEVLLLDEPTLGLDPLGARDLRRFLRDQVIRGGGRTAVVGTNDPGEARALGDRILLFDHGRLTRETLPQQLDVELGL